VIDSSLWYLYLRESVHGALHWIALDSLDLVEQLGDQLALLFQAIQNFGLFLFYELNTN
jgi:hypothetical protein